MGSELADAHHARIRSSSKVTHSDHLVSDVEERVVGQCKRGSFPLELEDDQTIVVSSSEEIQMRMGSQYPEPVVLSSESLNGGTLGHVPNPDGLVFTVRKNELVSRVEERHRYVVEMTSTGVDFPRLCVTHPPQLDLSVVST